MSDDQQPPIVGSSSSDYSDDNHSADEEMLKRRTSAKRRLFLAASVLLFRKRMRKKKRRYMDRRFQKSVEQFLGKARRDGIFKREFRMKQESFDQLCALLEPHLDVSERTHQRRDTLPLDLMVATALRYFAGASYIDLMRRAVISKRGVFRCIWRVVQAVCSSEEIGVVKFPETVEECRAFAREWEQLSGPDHEKGLFKTAVTMVDGLLVRIRAPSYSDTPKAEDYRSGHKKAYGLNVQAGCDARLRFMFFSCMTPGKTNDHKAYEKSRLSTLIEQLPPGFFAGGDNAYVNTEHMIVPYPGARQDKDLDTFNFYLSQLRRVLVSSLLILFVLRPLLGLGFSAGVVYIPSTILTWAGRSSHRNG